MRLIAAIAFLMATSSDAQRVLRSHLIQEENGQVRCALVVRKFETYDEPDVTIFRITNVKYLRPGDYHIGYFIDTAFVYSEWMHVSREKSVADQFIVIGDLKVENLRFGAGVNLNGVTYINTAPLMR